jgi:hypothetical protein
MTEEQAKKTEKKDKESPELKGELTDDELKGLSGGQLPDMDTVHLGGFGALAADNLRGNANDLTSN